MSRYQVVLFLILGLTGPVSAHSWADAMFDDFSRDFGSVPRGPILTHHFRLVNNTKTTVHIASVRASCGCVTATPLQTTLEAGQETAILIQMDTRRFTNSKHVTVYVQFDQPRFEEVRLWVQATSRDDLSILPDTLNFGRIKRGAAGQAAVTVTFLGSSTLKVLRMKSESNYVQPFLKEIRRDNAEVTYQLSAKMRNDAPVGRWFTDIWLTTDHPTMTKVRIPVAVEIESALSLSPSALSLGQIKAGVEMDRKVILRGVKPFRITAITGTDGQLGIRNSHAEESKSVHVLTVTVRPTQPGELNRIIQVQTDLKEGGDIEFQTRALVMP